MRYFKTISSGVARVWRTAPTPEARIVMGRKIVLKSYFHVTLQNYNFALGTFFDIC
jgi:hypothetical protein